MGGWHMDKKLLGRQINRARKDQNLTSEKLSEACNINATYLRQIESGAKMPSLPVFVSICRELKVSPSYLLSDILPDLEIKEMDVLIELWQTATPKQIKIISAMVQSALDKLQEWRLKDSAWNEFSSNVLQFKANLGRALLKGYAA